MRQNRLSITSGVVKDLWRYYMPHMPYDYEYHRDCLVREQLFVDTSGYMGGEETWLDEMGIKLESKNDKVTFLATSSMIWERSAWWKSRIKPVELSYHVIYDGVSRDFSFKRACGIGMVAVLMALALSDLNANIDAEDWLTFLLKHPEEMQAIYHKYQVEGYLWYAPYRDILVFYTEPARLLSSDTLSHHHEEITMYM